MFGVIKYLSQVITKFDDVIAGSSSNEKENAHSPNVKLKKKNSWRLSLIVKKIWKKISLGLKITRFVVSVLAYLSQVAQRQRHI